MKVKTLLGLLMDLELVSLFEGTHCLYRGKACNFPDKYSDRSIVLLSGANFVINGELIYGIRVHLDTSKDVVAHM